jgi:hypothetical protein
MGVEEGLLGNELVTAMKGAPKTAANLVIRLPPGVLSSGGSPPIPQWGWRGSPSGIRVALERLDRHYKRDLDDDELDSLEAFYKTHRTGRMREYLDTFETNLEEAAIRAGLMMSVSSLSWHLIKGAGLTPLQRLLLMSQVAGNLRRYADIRFLLRKMFPFDKEHPLLVGHAAQDGALALTD